MHKPVTELFIIFIKIYVLYRILYAIVLITGSAVGLFPSASPQTHEECVVL